MLLSRFQPEGKGAMPLRCTPASRQVPTASWREGEEGSG
jgi:hypothetical protein